MTERSDTGNVGGGGGDYFGKSACPDGHVIVQISGRSGSKLDQICAKCSDGTSLGCFGGGGGSPFVVNGPFKSVSGRAGSVVDQILGAGGGGNAWTKSCPAGKYVVGITGRTGSVVDQVGFVCGVDAKEYCIGNLETDLCRNAPVATLNKACAKNMSQTCINRKDELDETVIQAYCATHKDDPFCACYRDSPEYIPNKIRGLVKCWDKTCAERGYIPKNLRVSCPNITICRQALDTNDSNVLTNNVIIQDCGTTIEQPKEPDNPSPSNPFTPVLPNPPADDSFLEKNKMLLILILIFVAVIVGVFYESSEEYPVAYPVSYQTQM